MLRQLTLCIILLLLSTVHPLSSKGSRGPPGNQARGKKRSTPDLVSLSADDMFALDYKLHDVVSALSEGGMGVIPTDTCYSFVTKLSSREGTERLMRLKGTRSSKKPLSLLCKDLSMVAKYTSSLPNEQWIYKTLKQTLPGPYTFIISSSKDVPKMLFSEKHRHTRRWRRKEVGIRIPDDDVFKHIIAQLDEPLLCGSVPQSGEDILDILFHHDFAPGEEASKEEEEEEMGDVEALIMNNSYIYDASELDWLTAVDFLVENGPRPKDHHYLREYASSGLSTIVDCTSGAPRVLRKGIGAFDFGKVVV